MKPKAVILFVFILCFRPSHAQQIDGPFDENDIAEQMERLGIPVENLALQTERLEELATHPLNINKADYLELKETGLFSDEQLHALMMHRIRFGPLLSMCELQVIDNFKIDYIHFLGTYFITGIDISSPNAGLKRMIQEGQQYLLVRSQFIPEQKQGYISTWHPPAYAGSPLGLYCRYRFSFMNRLMWGITAEKDPGEQLFQGDQKRGFDFYSAHLFIRNYKKIKALAVGDYTLGYGQGLLLSSGFASANPSDPSMVIKSLQGIGPYTSAAESGFNRGVACSYQLGHFTLDLFYSNVHRDANIYADSSDNFTFTSFQTSGLHRTWYEIADRHVVNEALYGFHLGYNAEHFSCGMVILKNEFNVPYYRTFNYYNQFDFYGSQLHGAGFHFNWLIRNVNLFGEIATDTRGMPAYITGAVLSIDPSLSYAVVVRNYPRDWHALHGSAMGEASRNMAERGLYAGLSYRPLREWSFLIAADHYRFDWLRFNVDAPSNGYSLSLNINNKPTKKSDVGLRFRFERNEVNATLLTTEFDHTTDRISYGVRFWSNTDISKSFTFRARVEAVNIYKEDKADHGVLLFQDLLYRPLMSAWDFSIRYAVFETDTYDSRIYAYENDVLYGYSIPALYYKGTRFCFNIHRKLSRNTDFWLKYALSSYRDRDYIGSGYEEIEGNKRTEIKVQLRFVF